MHFLLQLVLLFMGFVCLVKGSDFFVGGSSAIAKRFGIPELVVGLTIVAMGTSAPEAAVSITAAFKGNADIAIGNVVGSNSLNILVILGLAALLVPIAVKKSTVRVEMPFMIGTMILLAALGLDGKIGRLDGLIFWILFIIYLLYLLWMAKKDGGDSEGSEKQLSLGRALVFTVVGLLLIVVGSNWAVDGASGIARAVGISERFIGLTVVALGTSLPELFTSVTAARRGNADIAIGNIVGSNIFNILFVLGTSALITPINYGANFRIDGIISAAAGLMLLLFCLRDRTLKRWGGILLLIGYAGYFIYLVR